MRATKPVDFQGIARHHNVNIMLYKPKKDRGKHAGSIWQLVYGKAKHKNKQLADNKHGIIGRPLFVHQEDGSAS